MAIKSPAAERAESFLETSSQFRLGALVTEASHPRSTELSQVARARAADGLAILFDVDRDVVAAFAAWSRTEQPHRVAEAVLECLRRGGRIYFTGCGATGRLSIQLDAIWRAFWQQRRSRPGEPAADLWEDRTRSVMAGGDYALIKSVEGFEDLASFGRKQIGDLAVGPDDVVFAITEGGETSFVIGTAWQALESGARVFFVYNNPDEVLRGHVRRSREVIDEPRIEKINLTTGPMAITGSTRMQATSVQLAAMLTILEMVLRSLLGGEALREDGIAGDREVPAAVREGLEAVQATLAGGGLRTAVAGLVEAEEAIYRSGARMSYLAGTLGVDVLTDTTERSPTFCTPSFRKWDDEQAADSWSFLFTPVAATRDAWPALLRRGPQTIEWSDEDLHRLLDPDMARRQVQVLREIGHSELMRFRIGLDGLASRPVRRGDGVTLVSAAADRHLLEPAGATFAALMLAARQAGAGTAMIAVGTADEVARLHSSAAGAAADRVVGLAVPGTRFLLDPLARVGVKMLLNALSTCTMVRLGRVLGNRMIWVVPSNLKLIDRSTRYIVDLAGVSYEQACHALFEVIEYVEPRRRAGQAYPAPVGVATMRLRHGISLEEAEARLLQELG
jgi:N-acetylmuramic acid 6-phosphate etherase